MRKRTRDILTVRGGTDEWAQTWTRLMLMGPVSGETHAL